MTSVKYLSCVSILALASACTVTREPFPSVALAATASSSAKVAAVERLTPKEVSDSVLAAMDRKADPCQDFYRYACGTWLDTTKLPPDRSRWGRGFTEISERNLAVLRSLLEDAAKDAGGDADRTRIGRFYDACMDEEGIERKGTEPLKPLLAEIGGVKDATSLMAVAGKLQKVGVQVLFDPEFEADFKNPDIYIAHFLEGGLGLPDRDYYVKDDAKSKDLRTEYQAHVGRMLALLGTPKAEAEKRAKEIVAFETSLARVSLPAEERRNPEAIYHKIDRSGLKRTAPQLPWDALLAAAGVPDLTSINVGEPAFFEGMARAAAGAKPDLLRAYLTWHLLHGVAGELPKAFVEEDFAFFGKTLSGQKELRPRWKRCVTATDEAVGESLGRGFVERQFPGESKAKALTMIQGIEAAFESNLQNLSWMDDATRARALEKRKAIVNKIGYPDEWRDYSRLQLKPRDYFGNRLAANAFEFKRQADRVGKAVDRKEWEMTPPTVNAGYNPLRNQMAFPAGILQRPFFHRDFPPAMNFGAIGMGMGHELTHGFDDQGRKFDGTGQLREWWEPAVVSKFEERAQCVEKLYSGYEVQPGLHLNGKLTLGENIADLGGVKEAFRAFHAWTAEHGEESPAVEGLTNDQLFFVANAQTWCTIATPEIERVLATIDPHSPPRFRIQGPLSNSPEFAQTFACAAGTPMNPVQKCEVW